MRFISKFLLHLTFLLLLAVFCKSSARAQVIDEPLKQDLLKVEQELIVRLKAHDTTALSEIVSSDYQLVGNSWTVPRHQWMQNVFLWHFDSATINRTSLTSWVNVAVFRSWQDFYNLVIGDETIGHTEAWITDLFMKRNGSWRLVTRISERMPPKSHK